MSKLLHSYHKELTNNLIILNYTGYIPTLDDINEEISANAVPIIAVTTLVNGFRLSEKIEKANISSMVEGLELSGYMVDLTSSSNYRKRMEFLLKYYDSMGFLD